jgi:hypothetical protein
MVEFYTVADPDASNKNQNEYNKFHHLSPRTYLMKGEFYPLRIYLSNIITATGYQMLFAGIIPCMPEKSTSTTIPFMPSQ